MKIDLDELEKLCAMQATQVEIASFFGVTPQAVEKRISENRSYPVKLDNGETVKLSFREIMERGYNRGKISLRRAQFQAALAGDRTMMVWLGKQILGQRDNLDTVLSGPAGGPIEITTNAGDILRSRIAGIASRRGS